MVPYRCPLHQAQSSMPTNLGVASDRASARLTRRSNVSGLVGTASPFANLAPASPPSADPMAR